ncbi:Ca-activated chloride channel family protein [Robiginitalea myxolifaciens]|uniref:Ca-activated chloride channel family protein n=1 Tax=Robiginitalea myxolifaciens TaxID=400055 RepID=A0A1I6H2R5_9FLAO|nr:VWA domain-containing protein [Robiginitalea myxolifaciens]SFR48641.1 Ca-activated chloride channel family protein [Robiginitalea myxolifaciens]
MKALFSLLVLLVALGGGEAPTPTTTAEITGIVTDSDGLPLPGVNVVVKGTTEGTQTDFDGMYSIQAATSDILVFTYLGMKAQKIKVGKNLVINVQMQEDSTALEEVVVVGYGVQKRKMATGAVTSVSAEYDAVRNLQGKASGVNVTPANGYTYHHAPPPQVQNNESYEEINENRFKRVMLNPLSTFSIDVDRAAYSNIRRMINAGQTIPEDAVKIEEMINYFAYDYPQPTGEDPFSITTNLAVTPWNPNTRLVRIGLQGKAFDQEELPASNLTFLIDVSGSMNSSNKLPLLKSAFKLLVNQLRPQDRVSIVVYAGAAGTVLPPTRGNRKAEILAALDGLQAGGSTAGGAGIELAYSLARKHFINGGNNRVILATDGDFNVGASSDKAMEDLIVAKRESGIFLSVLGFGMGNYKDSKLETLADKGNGNHAYIDTMQEAQKVFGEEFGGTLFTIAKDVKIQVEFNPAKVKAYRLIGYENRLLAAEDFMDDTKDAGELGSNHSVTALYEVLPVGTESPFLKPIPDRSYTEVAVDKKNSDSSWFTVRFRYKKPDGKKSKELVQKHLGEPEGLSEDFSFAASLALFGMQLRDSEFANNSDVKQVIALASAGKGADPEGYRGEFLRLVRTHGGNDTAAAQGSEE